MVIALAAAAAHCVAIFILEAKTRVPCSARESSRPEIIAPPRSPIITPSKRENLIFGWLLQLHGASRHRNKNMRGRRPEVLSLRDSHPKLLQTSILHQLTR